MNYIVNTYLNNNVDIWICLIEKHETNFTPIRLHGQLMHHLEGALQTNIYRLTKVGLSNFEMAKSGNDIEWRMTFLYVALVWKYIYPFFI
jgi:hypothetical protein